MSNTQMLAQLVALSVIAVASVFGCYFTLLGAIAVLDFAISH